jgi:YVTN family beta-propeller protein
LDFRILGPLKVVEDGRELPIRGRKLRALLALLLVHANEVVSRERLIEELWGEEPPPNASKTLQVHVSRLRRELGDVIVTSGGGYVLHVETGSLDRQRFEGLIEEGRRALAEGAPERAEETLGGALALWSGPPLADLDEESFARIESDRLAELHLEAVEERIEARLALGRPAEAIGELEPIVARHPFRERPRAQLMLALYRAGRQAEALAVYRRAREKLVEELGIEPGPRLRELQDAILAQDPALEGPRPAPAAKAPEQPATPATVAKRRRRSALPALVLAATLATAAVLLVVVLAGGADDSAAPLTDDSHAIAVIDPATNEVTTAASVGTNPGPLAYEPESRSLWVANLDDESVTRIHLRPLRTGRTIPIGQPPAGLAAGGGAVWVAGVSRAASFVTARRIDPRFDTAGRPVRVESFPEGGASIALGPNAVWVAPEFGRLTRLDPGTGRARGTGLDAGQSATAVAADRRAVWTADGPGGVISRIDPSTGAPQPFPVAGGPADIAIGAGAVWVSAALDDSVARIDPDTVSVRRTIPVGRRPAGVAVGAGAVWVANSGDGTVSRIDPRVGRVTETIPVGGSPTDVVVADGRVWVSVRPRRPTGERVTRGTLRAETPSDLDSLDPALAYQPLSFQIEYATCAKLTSYPDEEGTAGGRVAPELAESLPAPTDGGRKYTFRIRPGFRFSPPSGERVTARTLRYSIERSLHPSMRGPGAAFMSDLVGASAYTSGRARHVAGITVTGNTLTLRLARPSSTLLARLSLPLFCSVPVGTPIDPDGLRTVPSAGPYYVSSNVAGEEIVLRRNPNYGGSRPHRLDEVRITTGAGEADTLARVEAGEIDYALLFADARRARRL